MTHIAIPAHRRIAPTIRWTVTIAATVVSTWALDIFAAAMGLLLVASPMLDEAPRGIVIAFLVGSYLVWAAGLRINLIANWRLLEETGTSTNAPSKLMFELVRHRTSRQSVVRVASAAGYIATEIAKEAPYYAGVFGTVLLSDAVDSTDALIFLGGANIGAAVYELAVARLTSVYLERRTRRLARREPPPSLASYASFDDDWVPREYLADYYRVVEPDEQATIAFFVDAFRHAEPDQPVLLFGVGPTLHHVFLTVPSATEIHLADYLPANLREIERWLHDENGAHDWRPFVEYTLQCEGVSRPTRNEVRTREELTRAKIAKLLSGDARCADPLQGHGDAPYGTVISAYCADSATTNTDTWATYTRHIAGLVRPGGLFITSALRHSTGYLVGGKTFPSAYIDESDLRTVLESEFDWDDGIIDVRDLSEHRSQGYTSILLARARKRRTSRLSDVLEVHEFQPGSMPNLKRLRSHEAPHLLRARLASEKSRR